MSITSESGQRPSQQDTFFGAAVPLPEIVPQELESEPDKAIRATGALPEVVFRYDTPIKSQDLWKESLPRDHGLGRRRRARPQRRKAVT